jgi:NTP pyrophosphatase (non-canonical NTP hydrolase)
MDFETYIEKTRETAVYPEDYERDYIIHGLVNEIGELLEKVEDPNLDKDQVPVKYSHSSPKHVEEMADELGDAMWYLARIFDHFDFDVSVGWLKAKAHQDSISHEEGQKLVKEAFVQASKINGHQKKSVRDDVDKKDLIRADVFGIYKKLSKASHHLGVFNLEVVMNRNLDKLFDRKERGKLKGDGDNR